VNDAGTFFEEHSGYESAYEEFKEAFLASEEKGLTLVLNATYHGPNSNGSNGTVFNSTQLREACKHRFSHLEIECVSATLHEEKDAILVEIAGKVEDLKTLNDAIELDQGFHGYNFTDCIDDDVTSQKFTTMYSFTGQGSDCAQITTRMCSHDGLNHTLKIACCSFRKKCVPSDYELSEDVQEALYLIPFMIGIIGAIYLLFLFSTGCNDKEETIFVLNDYFLEVRRIGKYYLDENGWVGCFAMRPAKAFVSTFECFNLFVPSLLNLFFVLRNFVTGFGKPETEEEYSSAAILLIECIGMVLLIVMFASHFVHYLANGMLSPIISQCCSEKDIISAARHRGISVFRMLELINSISSFSCMTFMHSVPQLEMYGKHLSEVEEKHMHEPLKYRLKYKCGVLAIKILMNCIIYPVLCLIVLLKIRDAEFMVNMRIKDWRLFIEWFTFIGFFNQMNGVVQAQAFMVRGSLSNIAVEKTGYQTRWIDIAGIVVASVIENAGFFGILASMELIGSTDSMHKYLGVEKQEEDSEMIIASQLSRLTDLETASRFDLESEEMERRMVEKERKRPKKKGRRKSISRSEGREELCETEMSPESEEEIRRMEKEKRRKKKRNRRRRKSYSESEGRVSKIFYE